MRNAVKAAAAARNEMYPNKPAPGKSPLRSYNKIPCHCPEKQRSEGWMNLTRAAAFLGVSQKTLRLAAERGEIESEHPLADGPWLFNRVALKSQAANQIVKRARRHKQTPAGPSDAQQDLLLSTT